MKIKKMDVYVALIIILGVCYTGLLLFYNPYANKSYVYSYNNAILTNQKINSSISVKDKQAIDDFYVFFIKQTKRQ